MKTRSTRPRAQIKIHAAPQRVAKVNVDPSLALVREHTLWRMVLRMAILLVIRANPADQPSAGFSIPRLFAR
jgi:hypothetical protein